MKRQKVADKQNERVMMFDSCEKREKKGEKTWKKKVAPLRNIKYIRLDLCITNPKLVVCLVGLDKISI